VRIAIASFSAMPSEFTDDEVLLALLRDRGVDAQIVAWDVDGIDWDGFDLVVIRSTWNYTSHYDRFLQWTDSIGERLQNSPALVRWNSDKRYLGDLADAGLAVVETHYVAPGDAPPELDGEVVVKPAVSVGARSTGRFGSERVDAARALIARITSMGGTAMVQPYYASVDTEGETAMVFIDGEFSHALRKRAVLRPNEVAPIRDDAIGAAEVMYDPNLVHAGSATASEVRFAEAVIDEIRRRFGAPLYARVDVICAPDGSPVLLELEAIEPSLYFDEAPGVAERLADAILARGRST
jgi:glutathione synthase/RimK-type ligase-like ATP-grasp enzyme